MRVVFLCLLAAMTGIAIADDSHFANTDVFNLELAVDPQIAPDGSQVVYVRQSMDIMSDRAVANLWMVDTDGDNHRPLLSGRASYGSPRWSPDGRRLAYVSGDDNGKSQIHLRWMDTGQTAVLSNVQRSPQSISWS
ncbi:MAG: S9 family peptidase, partial [Pseudomonadota bacterium]